MASTNKSLIDRCDPPDAAGNGSVKDGGCQTELRSHTIAIDSLHIQFLTHSDKLHGWISSYYQPRDAADSGQPTAAFTIRLEEIDSAHAINLADSQNGVFTKFCLIADAHCYFADGKFTSQADGDLAHHIEINASNRTGHGNVGGVFLQSEESFIYVVLRDILRRLVLPLSGYLMLHGSVVTRDQQTIFFAGDKAMGKSTIALEMFKHGYKIVSDDSPIAALSSTGAHVLSGRDQLSVTQNTLLLFPDLSHCVSRQRDVSGKYFLDRNQLGDARLSSQAHRITDFIQLKRGSYEKAALNPIDRALASANMIREFMPLFRKELIIEEEPKFFSNTNQTMFQILSYLLAGARTYELVYSDMHRTMLPELLGGLDCAKLAK